MKNLLTGMLLFLVSTCCAIKGISQDVKQEIQKLNEVLESSGNLSMDVTYSVYPNHFSTKALESTKGSYKKSGVSFWSKTAEVEICQNERTLIYIDHEEKQMIVSDRPATSKSSEVFINLDSLLQSAIKSKIIPIGNQRRITLELPIGEHESEFSKLEVYYDAKSYLLNKVVIFYAYGISLDDEEKGPKEKPRLEISYTNVSSTIASNTIFSNSSYFIKSKKGLIGIGVFQSYTVIDQRIKK